MKVIIAGSRWLNRMDYVTAAMIRAENHGIIPTEIVSGCARGIDRLGERWAAARELPVKKFPAEWTKYGRQAGMRRNAQMAEYADALVAIWDGYSPGTKGMIDIARNRKLKTYVFPV